MKINIINNNQLKIGSILSYFQMGLNIVIGLIYTPVMIRILGKSEYGLYNTIMSTISMLSVLNFGFNSSYIRYFSKYKKKEDIISIYKLNGLYMIIFFIIGCVTFLCGIFIAEHLELIFKDGLSDQEYKIAKILMILLTINLSISFPMSVFVTIISAHEHYVILKLVGMIKTVISPLITMPLLLIGYRSIAMVVVTVLISIITDICYVFFVINKLKQKFIFFHFEKGIFQSLFIYTGFIAINLIIDQINWNVDKFLLGRFKGTESVAIYSVGYSLYSYYQIFSTSISGMFSPRIHRIINMIEDQNEKKLELTKLFIKVGRIQFFILSLIATGIIFFGKTFILNIWAGKGYEASYYVAIFLITSASIALIQNLGIEIQRAENKHQFRSIVYSIMAIINLLLSIYLCQLYGPIGSAVGTAISLILANGLIMNIYYHKHCNLDILQFWKNIASGARGIVIPILLGISLIILTNQEKMIFWIIDVILYSGSYCLSIWYFGMNDYEKSLIKNIMRNILGIK